MERLWDLETQEAGQGRGCDLREGVPYLWPLPCPRSGPLGRVDLPLLGCLLGSSKDGRGYVNAFIPQAILFNA